MIISGYKRFLLRFITAILMLLTTSFFYLTAEYMMSKPREISTQHLKGYGFDVVAMNGTQPVEMHYEYSENAGEAKPIIKADIDTGSYRYYLTDADLPKINSQLDSKPKDYPHNIEIKVLEDDSSRRFQILQLTVHADDTDFINVYQVKGNKIKPLKWINFRPRILAPIILLLPSVLVVSASIWKKLLTKLIFSQGIQTGS